MRKFLGVLFGLSSLFMAAVLAGPSFIDWNNYKDVVTRQVKEMTGRDLIINGKIRIAVLPAPALVVNDVSLANPDGATVPHMVKLNSAEIRVALGPLLGGQVKVEDLKLIEPVIHLERLSDGSANWEFKAVKREAGGDANLTPSGVTNEGPSVAPPIALDNLSIENATLIYRDSVSGVTEQIEKLSAQIAAVSLQGPMKASGSATVRSVPLTFELNVGEIIHDRTVPINLRAGVAAGNVTAQVGGTLVNLTDVPKFKGKVKVEGKDLAAALTSLNGAGVPALLAQSFFAGGDVTATVAEVQMGKVDISLGATRASGDLHFELDNKPSINARLEIRKVDLDALVAMKPASIKPGNRTVKDVAMPKIAMKAEKAHSRFTFPKGLEASVIVSIDAIAFRNDVIRDALLNAKMSDGFLIVNQVSGQFPGGSDLVASISVHTPDGIPTFSANVDSTVSDLRGVLRWLDVGLPSVPADRLRKISARAQMTGTPQQLEIGGLDLRFDSSRLTGGITVALRERLGFGANLTLDRLNVDSYMPVRNAKAGGAVATTGGVMTAPSNGGHAKPFSVLAALNRFDSNVKAHVKSLVYEKNLIRNLVVDATVYNGAVDLRRLSVGKYGGASASLRGKVKDLLVAPSAENLSFDVKITDPGRFARIIGADLSSTLSELGTVAAKGRLNGVLLRPQVDASVGLAGTTVGIKGRISAIPGVDMVDARISLKHKDLAGLARKFGSSYRPAGQIGGIEFDADVKASTKIVSVKNFRAAIGKLIVRGQADVALGGSKPLIKAAIETGGVVIDPFLRATPKRPRRAPSRASKDTTRRPSPRSPPASSRFPDDLIDLSLLNLLDADLTFRAPIIAYDKVLIEKPDLRASLKNGVLRVSKLHGQLFDGTLNATLEAATSPSNRLSIKGGLNGGNIAKSLETMTGEALANGRMKIDLDLVSTGRSMRDLVGHLGGAASVVLTDVDVEKSGKGSTMSGLLGLLTSLNKLSGSNASDRAQMTGSFRVSRGIAHSNNIKLASAYGNGTADGEINLPAWTINMDGQMQLGQTFIAQLLKTKIRETSSTVPFVITGVLDAPNVKVDTRALLGAEILIPDADALLKKAPKGFGNILRDVLGGDAKTAQPRKKPKPSSSPVKTGEQQAPADVPPSKPSHQQQDPAVKPEKLLKQLFKL